MPRILIVDDEAKIREVVKEYAAFEGYEVVEAADGMEAVEKVREDQNFDCIIMDIMMPKLDGYSACKEIKKIRNIPVIMLSARGEEYDKLFGFEVGIDDYVVKPFSPKELMARIKVAIKRSSKEPSEDIITYKGLVINFAARDVIIDGKRAQMTPKEYELLFYMVKNKNIALSRDKLLEKGTMCKMARGQMVRWLAENRVTAPEDIRAFRDLGYEYAEEYSDENHYIFIKGGR